MHGSTLQEVARAARHVAGYDELIHAARKACAGRLMYELNESFTGRTGTLYLQGTFGVHTFNAHSNDSMYIESFIQ